MTSKCLQANLHHAKGASAILSSRFTQEEIGVALIQEPWLRGGRICGITNRQGKLVFDRSAARPRAAILINHTLNGFPLNQFISSDLVAISISLNMEGGKRDIVYASAYFPGEEEQIPPKEVQELIQHCKRTNTPFIIGCDANAHNLVWGSTDNNDRGESLLEYLLLEGVHILNKGNKPTFMNAIRGEVLDLTLCSKSLTDYIEEWHVSDEESLSDHKHIRFDIRSRRCSGEARYSKRAIQWNNYKHLLELRLREARIEIESQQDIEDAARGVTDSIMESYRDCSKIIQADKSKNPPWWNPELRKQRSKVRKLFNQRDREEYNIQRNVYNKMIREAKTENWQRFCGELESLPQAARIHRMIAKSGSNGVGTIQRQNGPHTNSRAESLKILMEVHFPESTEFTGGDAQAEPSARARRRAWADSGRIFCKNRVEWAIRSFQQYKAPGEDGIYPALLQKGPRILVDILTEIFRASYTWGYIPSLWRKVNVIFLQKAGRPSDLAKSYRPVSLTSFLLKTMEKIMDVHIRGKLEKTFPLHEMQFAFQKGKSTEMALHAITDIIEHTFENQEITLGAFLDIEGAFDNTGFGAIIKALENRNIEEAGIKWIHSMLANRIISSTLGGERLTISSTKGCPQGGVLSPLLWSLVVDELLRELQSAKHTVIGYADDVAILVRGKHESTVREVMVNALEMTSNWCNRVGLSINAGKTTLVPFTYKTKLSTIPLEVNNAELKYADEVKYLGIILDKRLNWNRQIEHIYKKANRALWACSSYCGRTWGVAPRLMQRLYQSTIRPILTYAAWIWWEKTEQKGAVRKLGRIQRIACLLITGAMRTTPTAALEAMLGLTPIHLYIQRVAANNALKYACLNATGATRGHMAIIRKIRNWEYLIRCTDLQKKEKNFDKNFEVTILPRENWSLEALNIERKSINWYTDGSKTGEGTGLGVHGPNTNLSESLGKTATIFQAELQAIKICVDHINRRRPKGQYFTILSDSQAVIKALANIENDSLLVRECLEAIKELTNLNRLRICWVPGHIGVEGNEAADELARRGASTPFIGPEPTCGLNWSYCRNEINQWIEREVKRSWNTVQGLRQAKALINPKKEGEVLSMRRTELRRLTGYLTGHNSLRYHMHLLGLSTETACRLCGWNTESSEHLLGKCRALDRARFRIFGRIELSARDIRESAPRDISRLCKEIADLLVA